MDVGEARAIAARWVADEVARAPRELLGALTFGSINWMASTEPFPPTSDVDLLMLVPEVDPVRHRVRKRACAGVVVEPFFLPRERLTSAEALLADFGLAPNLVAGTVLFDPEGILSRVQATMAPDFPRRHWIRRRCRSRRDEALSLIAALEASDSIVILNAVAFHALLALAQMPLIADLQNPTVKKALVKARDVLARYDMPHEHAAMLRLLGADALDGDAILSASSHCASALDEACAWLRTPFPPDNHVSVHSRSALEVDVPARVAQGVGREIFLWIAYLHSCAMIAIENDAPPEVAACARRAYLGDMARIGAATTTEARAKMLACRPAIERMTTVCDDIVARNVRAVD
jgi:hypothetical protein